MKGMTKLNTNMRLNQTARVLAILGACAAWNAHAQSQPPIDSGQTLKQLQATPQPMSEGKVLTLPADIKAKLKQGGETIQLKGLRFTGNAHLDDANLEQALGGLAAWEKPLDLAGLHGLVAGVTDHYRASGYPFARAFLLPGSLNLAGVLNIRVVEGHYGMVVAVSPDEKVVQGAAPYLSGLELGDVVTTAALERATLILDDLPGYAATPVMKPGAQIGAGNLNVVMEKQARIQGGLTLDNQGSYYSGVMRVQGDLAVSRVAIFGDELALSALAPLEGTWMGSARYALPLGAKGARLAFGRTKTSYKLNGEFDGFDGTATEDALTLSYPLVRSRVSNLSASLSYKEKALRDNKLGTLERKDVQVTPLVLNFDRRDNLGKGGIIYGAFTVVTGELKQGGAKQSFSRWQLDVARLQRASASWNLFAHGLVQGTKDNLDSSEGFSLGGASGVRAYPTGEASGDKGWMIQLEARKSLGVAHPYFFYDYGVTQVDAKPDPAASRAPDQARAGVGVGLRVRHNQLNFNVALAWRTHGGQSKAEIGQDPKPRVWLSARRSF